MRRHSESSPMTQVLFSSATGPSGRSRVPVVTMRAMCTPPGDEGRSDMTPSSPMLARLAKVSRMFTTSVASVYPHYFNKVEKKGRSKAELDEVIRWLTGFDKPALVRHLDRGST